MNEEALKPGEVDLETGVTADEPVEEVAVVEEQPAAEAVAEEQPAVVVEEPPPAPEPRKPTGAVGELMELRGEAKVLRERLRQLEADPALQRLTPEIRQAIAEGRVVVAPPKTNADAEKERLTKLAERLDLRMEDGTPNLEAARRVGSVIRDEVQAEIAPVVAHTRAVNNQQIQAAAQNNIDKAVAAAKANGWDEAFVRAEFEAAAATNPAMLVQPEVAMSIWHTTVGKLHAAGKLTTAAKPKADTVVKPAAAPIISDPTGRRAPSNVVQMAPGLKRAYADAKIDPNTSYSATKGVDLSKGMDLE